MNTHAVIGVLLYAVVMLALARAGTWRRTRSVEEAHGLTPEMLQQVREGLLEQNAKWAAVEKLRHEAHSQWFEYRLPAITYKEAAHDRTGKLVTTEEDPKEQ